jgi:hypothetical protein
MMRMLHAHAGFYSASVLNAIGSAISQTAEITVRPELLTAESLSGGAFRFTYQGTPGRRYFVEVTTNVDFWSNLGMVTNTSIDGQFTDPAAMNAPTRKYRLRLIP